MNSFGVLIVAVLVFVSLLSGVALGADQGIVLLYNTPRTVMIPYRVDGVDIRYSLDDNIGVKLQVYFQIPFGSEIYLAKKYVPDYFLGMNYQVELPQLPSNKKFIGAPCSKLVFGIQTYTWCDSSGSWFQLLSSLPPMLSEPSKDIPHAPISIDGSTNKLVFINVPDGRWLMITLPTGESREGYCKAYLYKPVLPINP
ncbi:MAG: hypothetical protein WC242_02015 [Candidatus Paceibacterota bacterium]|jgi:hypothetical protein